MDSISTGSITIQGISKQGDAPYKNPGDVRFLVEYPKDYKGIKQMPEGPVIISKESAAIFTEMGIGKVVQESEKSDEVSDETDTQQPKEKKAIKK